MKRRTFFEKAAQLAAAIGMGGAAALAVAKPADAAAAPQEPAVTCTDGFWNHSGPARDLTLEDMEATLQQWRSEAYTPERFGPGIRIMQPYEDDLYSVFQRFKDEFDLIAAKQREIAALSIFGGK